MALNTPVVWELQPVRLEDRDTFAQYVAGLNSPLSDYTFAQVYGWRTALDLWWRVIDGHLCIFANGSNLSMLLPPLAPPETPGMHRALRRACEVMHDYNIELAARDGSAVAAPRIEGVSEELLARMPLSGYLVEQTLADYVYNVADMVELAGGAFKSKRHDRNHFMREWNHRTEAFDVSRHAEPCARLLDLWHRQSDVEHDGENALDTHKRYKEATAAAAQMFDADRLGLTGMVVWVDGPGEGHTPADPAHPTNEPAEHGLVAFTLAEPLGSDSYSVLVEKASRDYRGLAQFIYSDFCRHYLADRPFVNAGDDWGLETLARTKQSYRPVRMLPKMALTRLRPVCVFLPDTSRGANGAVRAQSASALETPVGVDPEHSTIASQEPAVTACASPPVPGVPVAPEADRLILRSADFTDIDAATVLEAQCFNTFPLSRRQFRHLLKSETAIFFVAQREAPTAPSDPSAMPQVVGEGIALIRRHRSRRRDGGAGQPIRTLTGRIYTLAVAPGERGRGTGRRLLEALLDELTRRGVARVFLEVAQTNTRAIGLYHTFGFETIGRLPDYYGEGEHGLHMVKHLTTQLPQQSQLDTSQEIIQQ